MDIRFVVMSLDKPTPEHIHDKDYCHRDHPLVTAQGRRLDHRDRLAYPDRFRLCWPGCRAVLADRATPESRTGIDNAVVKPNPSPSTGTCPPRNQR